MARNVLTLWLLTEQPNPDGEEYSRARCRCSHVLYIKGVDTVRPCVNVEISVP